MAGILAKHRGRLFLAAGVVIALAASWPAARPIFYEESRTSASRPAPENPSLATAGFDHLAIPRLPALGPEAPSALAAVAAPSLPPEVAKHYDRVIAPPPEEFDGPAAPRVAPPAELRQPVDQAAAAAAGTWAVVIGINDYPGSASDLEAAVNDASDTTLALSRLGVPDDRILTLTDGQATAGVIRSALGWLTENAGRESVGVFFYAGHVRKSGGHEAIVGADGQTITDTELANRLDDLQAHEAWIGIAACYGGGFTEVMAPGRVLTAAAPANELAYENSSFGRSYMVQYMIREAIIEGRASANIQTAFAYARDAIARDYPDREPVQFDASNGDVDLRPPEGAASAPAEEPPPESPPADSGGSGEGSNSPPEDDCYYSLGLKWCREPE